MKKKLKKHIRDEQGFTLNKDGTRMITFSAKIQNIIDDKESKRAHLQVFMGDKGDTVL